MVLRRGRAVVCATAALFLTGVFVAPPSSAAPLTSNCTLTTTKPTTDGTNVLSTTRAICGINGYQVVLVGNKIDEEVGAIWNTSEWPWLYGTQGSGYDMYVNDSRVCNGHGTDVYRAKGEGRDQANGDSTITTVSVSLTC